MNIENKEINKIIRRLDNLEAENKVLQNCLSSTNIRADTLIKDSLFKLNSSYKKMMDETIKGILISKLEHELKINSARTNKLFDSCALQLNKKLENDIVNPLCTAFSDLKIQIGAVERTYGVLLNIDEGMYDSQYAKIIEANLTKEFWEKQRIDLKKSFGYK